MLMPCGLGVRFQTGKEMVLKFNLNVHGTAPQSSFGGQITPYLCNLSFDMHPAI